MQNSSLTPSTTWPGRLAQLARLAGEGVGVAEVRRAAQATGGAPAEVEAWARRRLGYRSEPVEAFATVADVLRRGSDDCDGLAVVTAAIGVASGRPVRLRLFSKRHGGRPAHVAAELHHRGAWHRVDPTPQPPWTWQPTGRPVAVKAAAQLEGFADDLRAPTDDEIIQWGSGVALAAAMAAPGPGWIAAGILIAGTFWAAAMRRALPLVRSEIAATWGWGGREDHNVGVDDPFFRQQAEATFADLVSLVAYVDGRDHLVEARTGSNLLTRFGHSASYYRPRAAVYLQEYVQTAAPLIGNDGLTNLRALAAADTPSGRIITAALADVHAARGTKREATIHVSRNKRFNTEQPPGIRKAGRGAWYSDAYWPGFPNGLRSLDIKPDAWAMESDSGRRALLQRKGVTGASLDYFMQAGRVRLPIYPSTGYPRGLQGTAIKLDAWGMTTPAQARALLRRHGLPEHYADHLASAYRHVPDYVPPSAGGTFDARGPLAGPGLTPGPGNTHRELQPGETAPGVKKPEAKSGGMGSLAVLGFLGLIALKLKGSK
jgi:hypothetical protein